ncbi:hypothetical protein BDP27DRAFT_1426089 [Rhodocollybia butyracea]|uniref:Uncharacterized protein n=1 Tax=Rhodocollybia butyracea TaxID=206335 RepID=A0A9P5PIZ4_9AGAR|nr:hypothetical protein BDP27DRAFT_1426089 [Rhodocollybia butyracea]
MSQVPFLSTFLADVPIESFAYGIFFVLSIASSIFILMRHSPMGNTPNRIRCNSWLTFFRSPMVLGSIGIFASVTAHWIITFIRLFEAFVTRLDNPQPYLAALAQPTYIVKTGFLCASLLIADVLVIYRLWIIIDKQLYIVLFPMSTCFGLLESPRNLRRKCYHLYGLDDLLLHHIPVPVKHSVLRNRCIPSMAGISFMLINVRVGLGWAKIAEPTVVTTGITAGSNMPMRPLAISISQVIEDSEGGGVETSHYSETSQYGERKPDGL